MFKITPLGNNVIVRILEKKENKEGLIVIPDAHVADSTIAEVMIPPVYSYHPNGDIKTSVLKTGMHVRLPVGKIGTELPEAPDGEKWLSVPEDCLYYIVEKQEKTS